MMADLLEIREKIRRFFSLHERILVPLFRFVLALGCFAYVNTVVGYDSSISGIVIAVLALICAFLPWGCITLFAGGLILMQMRQVSLEVFLTTAVIFILMFLIYVIFLPKYSVLTAVLPALFFLKVPFIAPLMFGLVGGFSTAIPIAFGVVWYYLLDYVSSSAGTLTDANSLTFLERYVQLLNGLKDNQMMYSVIAAFVISLLLVVVIKKLQIDHPRILAVAAGTVANVLIILFGILMFPGNDSFSLLTLLIGSLVSALLVAAADFMALALDYKRTEQVQFEDDEYYYYVKAVPKIAVTVSDVQVKEISPQSQKDEQSSEKGER